MLDHSTQVRQLFEHYMRAFSTLDINAVSTCYHLPCLLSTPEKIILLENRLQFVEEFKHIFAYLKQHHVTGFKASNASFQHLNNALLLMNVDWQFIDKANNLIADFSAIYHLTSIDNQLKIIQVNSVDISQSLSLENKLILNVEKNEQ